MVFGNREADISEYLKREDGFLQAKERVQYMIRKKFGEYIQCLLENDWEDAKLNIENLLDEKSKFSSKMMAFRSVIEDIMPRPVSQRSLFDITAQFHSMNDAASRAFSIFYDPCYKYSDMRTFGYQLQLMADGIILLRNGIDLFTKMIVDLSFTDPHGDLFGKVTDEMRHLKNQASVNLVRYESFYEMYSLLVLDELETLIGREVKEGMPTVANRITLSWERLFSLDYYYDYPKKPSPRGNFVYFVQLLIRRIRGFKLSDLIRWNIRADGVLDIELDDVEQEEVLSGLLKDASVDDIASHPFIPYIMDAYSFWLNDPVKQKQYKEIRLVNQMSVKMKLDQEKADRLYAEMLESVSARIEPINFGQPFEDNKEERFGERSDLESRMIQKEPCEMFEGPRNIYKDCVPIMSLKRLLILERSNLTHYFNNPLPEKGKMAMDICSSVVFLLEQFADIIRRSVFGHHAHYIFGFLTMRRMVKTLANKFDRVRFCLMYLYYAEKLLDGEIYEIRAYIGRSITSSTVLSYGQYLSSNYSLDFVQEIGGMLNGYFSSESFETDGGEFDDGSAVLSDKIGVSESFRRHIRWKQSFPKNITSCEIANVVLNYVNWKPDKDRSLMYNSNEFWSSLLSFYGFKFDKIDLTARDDFQSEYELLLNKEGDISMSVHDLFHTVNRVMIRLSSGCYQFDPGDSDFIVENYS